jgi:hypothetical protein
MRNPEAINAATLPNRKSPWKTVEEEQAARQFTAEAQINAWRAILPGLLEKFARLKDPRRPGSIRHKLNVLMVYGLLLFIFQYTSRREANRELSHPGILDTLRSVFPEVDIAPHLDTLARLLERIPADKIEYILGTTVRKLLRKKKLQALLVEKHYVVAIDGTQKFSRRVPFAPEALHRKSDDQTNYIVYLLEAVLVGPQGIVIPLLAEFCESLERVACANASGPTDQHSYLTHRGLMGNGANVGHARYSAVFMADFYGQMARPLQTEQASQ